ncbi:hypothetical protein [Agromyces cerinus]|uniref:Uncharacterized protein n=1 Tax=Agromyces cerinus subsp. cerinus TaxID=232089 RepID=A0A1N6FDB8_9MICO|nr:hypothetical protein [Agromyces cerinus]SIN93268.1 hypothetical protein SAMN05443544_1952 [Agromyces cerinus subsp. cerinus]
MKFSDEFSSRDDRYSLGMEGESGRRYVSFPVSNGVVDYEEYCELSTARYEQFRVDPTAAMAFVEESRGREHDELLMLKPGWSRGTPV